MKIAGRLPTGIPTRFRAAAILVAVVAIFGCAWRTKPPKSQPGGDLFAVVADIVTEVRYEDADRTAVLNRNGPGSLDFAIIVRDRTGKLPRECHADTNTQRVLKALFEVHVVRQLSPEEVKALRATQAKNLVTLTIRGSSSGGEETFVEWRLLPREAEPHPTTVIDGDLGWDVDIVKDAMRTLREACQSTSR